MRHTKRTIETARELQGRLADAFRKPTYNSWAGAYEIAVDFDEFEELRSAVRRLGFFIDIMEADTEEGWCKE